MTTKKLGVLAVGLVFAITPSFGQVSTTPNSAIPAISHHGHGPMRLVQVEPGGSVTSANWSGYAVTGSAFTYANGSWHVPQVSCAKTPNTVSAFWVGIDGYSNSTVEQVGTESDCNGTTPVYYAWYEFYPKEPTEVVISSMSISPGDKMGGWVFYNGGNSFTVFIEDYTTGQAFTTSKTISGAKRTSAEWIAEAPCTGTGCSTILPLADFVRANYGVDYNVLDPDSCKASDSVVNDGVISAFGSHVEKITMAKGVTESVPTALTSDGASFRINWKAE